MDKLKWLYICLNYRFAILEDDIKNGDYKKEKESFEIIDDLVNKINELEIKLN